MHDNSIEHQQLLEIAAYRNNGKSPHHLSNKYLYMPFSYKVHSQVFINYCEVIIWPDGTIEYAIPSHSEKCLLEYCKLKGWTREYCVEHFRHDADCYDKMMSELGIIYVWYNNIHNVTRLTDAQLNALSLLLCYGCIEDRAFDSLRVF